MNMCILKFEIAVPPAQGLLYIILLLLYSMIIIILYYYHIIYVFVITGSADFFGLNFYNGGNVVDNPEKNDEWNPAWEPNFWDDKATRGGRHEPSWSG
mgnify:FL=1